MDKFLTPVCDRRQRVGRLNSSEEVLKRKREEDEEVNKSSKEVEKQKLFKKSSLTSRSPSKNTTMEANGTMDQILKKLSVLDEIKCELRELKESNELLRKSNDDLKDEIRRTQDQLSTENIHLKEKMKCLEEKIKDIELNEERREKREKKNNIIISQPYKEGFNRNEDHVKEYASKVLTELANEEVRIINANFISVNQAGMMIVNVKLENFGEKMKIMKLKAKLRGTRTFISDDFTKKEAEIQKKLRDLAKEENKKGNRAFVGYQKININGKWSKWDEKE